MKTLTHTITAAMLISVGIFSGHLMFSQSGESDGTEEMKSGSPRSVRISSPSVATTEKSNNKRDLTLLIKHTEKADSGMLGLDMMFDRMSVSELKQLARDQFRALVELEDGRMGEANRTLYSGAVLFLFDRIGVEALDWALEIENSVERGMMLDELFLVASGQDVSALLAWMKANDTKSEIWRTKEIYLSYIVRGAAKVNADDMILAFSLFKKEHFHISMYGTEFSQDFDFAKLHQALGDKEGLGGTYGPWAERDRDGVWAFLEDRLVNRAPHSSGNDIRELISTVVKQDGEVQGVKWLMERVIKLSPEIISGDMIKIISDTNLSGEGFAVVGNGLDASVRPDFAALLVQKKGVNPLTYGVLDRLSRQELMEVVTQTLSPLNPYRYATSTDRRPAQIVSHLTERYHLTPEEIATAGEDAASEEKE